MINISEVQEKCLSLLGIKTFHNAGYKGKRVKIMSNEKVFEKDFPNIIAPAGYQVGSEWHGNAVMQYIEMVAPEAILISYPISGVFSSNGYKSDCIDYILSEKVNIFTTSKLGSADNNKKKALQKCIDEVGTIFFAAAGNKGGKGVNKESAMDVYLAIGGVKYKSNILTIDFDRISYSSYGDELDYMTIAEIPLTPTSSSGVSGTSFCSPVFAAMVGLAQDFFIDKTGKPLGYSKMIEFIRDNCVDLKTIGFDKYTGYGIFILPNPITINIKKYCPDYQKEENFDYQEEKNNENKDIELKIGSKIMKIGDKEVIMDVAPFIKDSRTFVPVKFVSEALNKQVLWDGNSQKVIIKEKEVL